MDSSFLSAREVTREHAKTFYFASHVLPLEVRRDSYAVYACCRTIDDVVDRAQTDAFFLSLKQAGNYVRRFVMQGAGHYWLSDPIEEPGSVSGFFAPRLLRFLGERL